MKVIVCEDNSTEREALVKLLSALGDYEILALENALDLRKHLQEWKPYIIFLDIDMPLMNGIEAGKLIRQLNSNCFIIYITGYEQFALEAFSVYAFDYIQKPLEEKRLRHTLERIKVNSDNRVLDIKIRQTRYRIMQKDILFIEKKRNKCYIYTNNLTYELISTLEDLHKLLDANCFIRTHKGYIVNLKKIARIEPAENLTYKIHFSNSEYLAYISRNYRHILSTL